MLDFRNTNTLWASVLVETLVHLGLETAVISPGSRSTPLTVALATHPCLETIPVLDERSAAFFALGIAKRTGKAVVLVCTSGTAGANYYPAVIEAHESQVPLLLLTADRPPEMRDCASGQTIDQQKLFGNFPNWYTELAVPVADLPMLRYLRQTLAQAWQRSHHPVPGPVHINSPFRDPLPPLENGSTLRLQELSPALEKTFFATVSPLPVSPLPVSPLPVSPSPLSPSPLSPSPLSPFPRPTPRTLIIAGPAQPLDPVAYCQAIAALARQFQSPVLGEGLSPLRNHAALNPHLITTYDPILRQADLAQTLVPDQVIQIGPLPTSKVLRQWLEQIQPQRWVVDPGYRNLDPLHGPTIPLPLPVEALGQGWPMSPSSPTGPLVPAWSAPPDTYLKTWRGLDAQVRQRLDQAFAGVGDRIESKATWLLSQILPPETPIFIANSMPVRDVEWFWGTNDRGIQPWFNRGANGIDGTLSTALGVAHRYRPTVLLTGDLALLHDTNGFLIRPHLQGHLTVVVMNNQGGGIFEMLPIARFDPPFETYFATPQAIDIAQLCAAYSVDYEAITDWEMFTQRLSTLPTQGIRVLEVRCDRKQDAPFRQTLLNTLAGDLHPVPPEDLPAPPEL